MAGIITNVGEDIKSLQQLRQEIDNVKKALGSIDVNVKIDIRKELEQKLQALTKQYDILVSKAAEADAKIMESAARIDKAVDTITKAQEKAAKANEQQTISSDKGQASVVEGQAKAYVDLKDEIDSILGTREQNIQQMMREQNAIRLINAEIAQINKSRQYGGDLTTTQSQRLQYLNDELLTHKQALAEVRQELNNNAKLDIAAVGSMNELSQSLSRMRIAYRALNEDERNSEFGQNLLKSIQDADTKIKDLDATIGNHQRNVGNYQGSFNGLNMSVQQIVRELPSATMGINMFFLAISNNLPILADQIKYTKEANAAMKAAGQEPIPVWKQLVSSLFSWQTAMMVGISLLTMYGKDIIKWVGNLFKANDAQEQARREAEAFAKTVQKSHEEWRNSVAQTASQQIASYRRMQREWNALGNDLSAKRKYVDANKIAFNQLGFAVNGVSEAERVMTGNTDAVVASIMARAKAAAYYSQMQEATERYIKQTEYNKGTVAGGGYYSKIKAGKTFISTGVLPQELKGLRKEIDYTEMSSGTAIEFTLLKSGAAKINARRSQDAADKLSKNQRKARAQLDKQLDSLQNGLESITKENQNLLNKIGVSEYKDYNEYNPKANKSRNVATASGTAMKQIDYDKMRREQSDAESDLIYKVSQAKIDAMRDSFEKEKEQRDLNHKKEMNDIERERRDFLQKKIDDAKQIFESDPKNKGKKFNVSSIKLSVDEERSFNDMRKYAQIKHANEDAEAENTQKEYMQNYMKQYGTMQEQRRAISEEYDRKIANEQNEWLKKTLEEQKKQAIAAFDFNQFKNTINWDMVFGDLENYTKKALRITLAHIKSFRSSDEFKKLSITDKKSFIEAQVKLEDATSTNVFKEFRESAKSLKEAQQALDNAKLMNRIVNSKGSIFSDEKKRMAQDNVVEAQDNLNAAQDNVWRSATRLEKALIGAGNAMQSLGKSSHQSLADVGNNVVEVLQGLGKIGEKAGGIISAIISLLDAIQKEGFFNFAGNVIGNVLGAVGSVFHDIGSVFGLDLFGMGSARKRANEYKNTVNKYENLKDIWDSLISKKKEYLNMLWGKEAANAQDEIDKLYGSEIKGTQAEAASLFNTIVKHHAASHTLGTWENAFWSNGGEYKKHAPNNKSFWYNLTEELRRQGFTEDRNNESLNITGVRDFFNLTKEELEYIKTNYSELWATQNDNVKKYLETYLSQLDAMDDATQDAIDNIIGSVTDLTDALKDLVTDSTKDFSDVVDGFNKTVNDEIWESLTKKGTDYYKRMETYQKHWQDAEKDGIISKEEEKALQKEYASIYKDVRDEYNKITADLGTGDINSSQKATANGISSITYEQANNIVALTTAGNISRDQIKDVLTAKLSSIDVSITGLQSLSKDNNSIADDLRTIQANSYIELQGIHEDTTSMNKAIKSMGDDVADIKKKIKEI